MELSYKANNLRESKREGTYKPNSHRKGLLQKVGTAS